MSLLVLPGYEEVAMKMRPGRSTKIGFPGEHAIPLVIYMNQAFPVVVKANPDLQLFLPFSIHAMLPLKEPLFDGGKPVFLPGLSPILADINVDSVAQGWIPAISPGA